MQFITFLNQCVIILSQFLGQPFLTDAIKHILTAYYEIVLQLQSHEEEEEGGQDEEEIEFMGIDDLDKKNERMSVFTVCLINFLMFNSFIFFKLITYSS
jgi:hypothetical protein